MSSGATFPPWASARSIKRILLKHNIFVNVIQGPSTLYFYPFPEIWRRVTPPQATDTFSSCSPNTWTGAEHNPSLPSKKMEDGAKRCKLVMHVRLLPEPVSAKSGDHLIYMGVYRLSSEGRCRTEESSSWLSTCPILLFSEEISRHQRSLTLAYSPLPIPDTCTLSQHGSACGGSGESCQPNRCSANCAN